MKNWREVFNPKEFKPYETDNKVDLPNMAEFSGDKFPKSGDPAKIELNDWHSGNSEFKKQKSKEDGSTAGSSLMNPKKFKEELTSTGGWRNVFADVQFEQKPDGSVKINVEYPNDKGEEIPNIAAPLPELPAQELQQPQPEEQPETAGKKASQKEWTIRKQGSLELRGRESATDFGISLHNGKELLLEESHKKTARVSSWREVINEAQWCSVFESAVK